ncbi:MAG TPA: type VI secretion system-associated protein TagF [Methylomirabilota bacterium]
MTAGSAVEIPGWYGKLPSLGDFASRRLPEEFIRPWDAWLQECLQASRDALGEAWQDCYLTTPIWRFALLPGCVGPSGWAGVLMPSVDRVGRSFPLTLALALTSSAAVAHVVFDGADWLARLEESALGALDMERGADDLDAALADLALAPPASADLEATTGALQRLPSLDAFPALARGQALAAWSARTKWAALWWTRGRVDDDPLMLASAGLPTTEEFGWLLQSRVPAPGQGADRLIRP